MDPLPKGVQFVGEPAPDVEVLVLGPGMGDDAAALFKQLPGLKFVQSFGAGVDHLLPNIPPGAILCSAAGVHYASASEWVMAGYRPYGLGLSGLFNGAHRSARS